MDKWEVERGHQGRMTPREGKGLTRAKRDREAGSSAVAESNGVAEEQALRKRSWELRLDR